MNTTSLEAYYGEVVSHKTTMQRKVLELVLSAKRPVCNKEIADKMDMPINSITPRVNELVKGGRMEAAFKAIYPPTGRRVTYWRPV